MRWSALAGRFEFCAGLLAALLFSANISWCQASAADAGEQNATLAQTVRDLDAQVKELRAAVNELRSQTVQSRNEMLALRKELESARHQSSSAAGVTASAAQMTGNATGYLPGVISAEEEPGPGTEKHPVTMDEQLQLLGAKIDEQYQTKVESASKYRVRLSGMVLLNMYSNRGYMDNADSPHLIQERAPDQARGNFGGSLRQTLLGLEVFGPEFAGARTHADVQFDFAGGSPNTLNGVTFGLVRMRTATMHMDWENTSLIAGQDALFFSPVSPTSLASVAEPALSYAGNLWSWVPQIRVEHQFKVSANTGVTLQGGILDSLSGEPPLQQFYRSPQAGEASNIPAVASRAAFTTRFFGQPLAVGIGGYYSRQNWGFGRVVDGWAGTSDWNLPLGHVFNLSGEFYRGRALGGLGGGIGRSVLFNGAISAPTTVVQGLDDMGGWSQLKFKPWEKFEVNAAFGQDSSFAGEVRAFSGSTSYFDPKQASNRSEFVNFIYHPRSDLLFSMEYRRIKSSAITDMNTGNHVNLGMGILF